MTDSRPSFEQLGLSDTLMQALKLIGYESPSPIQWQSIPPILEGRDVLGQAQTGTGKTAAFALPILQQLDVKTSAPQVLVLAPTRELAIQVAEAFQSYAHFMPGFHILPIYGGSAYDKQIRGLKRGVHVVVGTPGRVMDHMRKGTLKLDNLKHLVLDEADEMLRMGFIDDVEWILSRTPENRQIALFSATMPKAIAQVAKTYLRNPVNVKIEVKTTTAETIRQRYWPVSGLHKLDALTRILEVENFDGMIIFVRTKTSTVELAEKLEARGYASAALNGDISQVLRERTIDKLKKGQIDILVATDVAARGLDVERISHVLNYDIPYDNESYVHRIGRTGRAGREGEAILFVSKREMRLLRSIEKATGKPIEPMTMPSAADINLQRLQKFKDKIRETLDTEEVTFFRDIISEFNVESGVDLLDIAAALAAIAQGSQPLMIQEKDIPSDAIGFDGAERGNRRDRGDRKKRDGRSREDSGPMDTYKVEVGRNDGVRPSDLVGAIANEGGIDSQYIGYIKIHDDFCTVDLPQGMPSDVFRVLKKAWVCQKQLNLSLLEAGEAAALAEQNNSWREDGQKPRKPGKPGKGKAKFGGDRSSGKPSGKRGPSSKRGGNDRGASNRADGSGSGASKSTEKKGRSDKRAGEEKKFPSDRQPRKRRPKA